jgi:asparagine synthase (glutamine-hydrolysing)
MCGILGGNLFKTNDDMKNGLTSMMHRGTDGNTIFSFKKNMKLSHNRLSIQDLSEIANQPMISDDERYYIAFNGELWKSTFKKFDKKLRSKYNFKTDKSDTELLLYILIDNIDNLEPIMNEIEGMFSFAFYDKKEDKTILGRDFMGRLPFYYFYNNTGFVFSSEVKGLTESIDYLQYYNIDKGSTFNSSYKEKELIKIVEPGTLTTFESDKTFEGYKKSESVWFDFKPTPFDTKHPTGYYPRNEEEFGLYESEDKGIDYYSSEFKRLLEEAVDDEMIADVPICTILSGGIDSTIISYILSKKLKKQGKRLTAYVVNVNKNRKTKVKDDVHYAKVASDLFDIDLKVINYDEIDVKRKLTKAIWASETHKWTQVAPAVIQLALAWKIRKDGFKVVFGGEGADEIFASYGDVKRFCWHVPIHYHQKRVNLLNSLHKTNLIRTNKAMMYGGEVELRTPFINKKVIDFGLRIPTKYRDDKEGTGQRMKYVLRKAFEKEIGSLNEELLWRPKKTFQVGAHSDFLKQPIWKSKIEDIFKKLFIEKDDNKEIRELLAQGQSGHNRGSITEITIS